MNKAIFSRSRVLAGKIAAGYILVGPRILAIPISDYC
jgi:hypothetical protein